MEYFAIIYLAFENITLVLISPSGIATIVVKKILMMLIYILGKPLDGMTCPDQTRHLVTHISGYFNMDDRHVTLIQCNVNEAELDLKLIIGRESHLDQSRARYLGQSCTERPSCFP